MSQNPLSAREAAVQVVRELHAAGFVAYLAGGCVRDMLLGIEPKDYDVATEAEPKQVLERFPKSRHVGESFGVMLVHRGGHPIEVATFRSDWGYHDGRRPDHVIFTDAEHDAQRRDFTINGLFADPLETDPATGRDRMIDFVGGRADLKAGLVRAIGDPNQRFGEDFLRMMRAVRFAARLGFEIEPATSTAIRASSQNLAQISRERIGQEVQWMLGDASRSAAAAQLQALDLDAPILNEPHCGGALPTLEGLNARAGYAAALAAWMIDRHAGGHGLAAAAAMTGRSDPIVRRWRRALCLSNEHRDELKQILALLPGAADWAGLDTAAAKRLLARPAWSEAAVLLQSLLPAGAWSQVQRDAERLFDQGVAPPPLVTGDDLIEMGLEPGPAFADLLDRVYDAQLDGRVGHREQALEWLKQKALGSGDV